MSEYILDAINLISKGRSTNLRIGSRAVPHRLTQKEREQVKRGLKYGYLETYSWNRDNSINIFLKLTNSLNLIPIVCQHNLESSAVLIFQARPELNILLANIKFKSNFTISKFEEWTLINYLSRSDAKEICKVLSRNFKTSGNYVSL